MQGQPKKNGVLRPQEKVMSPCCVMFTVYFAECAQGSVQGVLCSVHGVVFRVYHAVYTV